MSVRARVLPAPILASPRRGDPAFSFSPHSFHFTLSTLHCALSFPPAMGVFF